MIQYLLIIRIFISLVLVMKKNINFFSLNINFLFVIFIIAHKTRNYRKWEISVSCSFFIFYKRHRVTYVARSNGFNTLRRLCINRSQKLSWSLQLIRTRIKRKKEIEGKRLTLLQKWIVLKAFTTQDLFFEYIVTSLKEYFFLGKNENNYLFIYKD